VNSTTGLDQGTLAWPCATDWSEASYIYAIIFARKLNLIVDNGAWQYNDRISKILNFLSTRRLTSNGTAYWAYNWDPTINNGICLTNGQLTTGSDSGRFLGALNAVRVFSPSYGSQVNSIFMRSKTVYNYFSTSNFGGTPYLYYAYFVAQGYAAFGYDESAIFNALDSYSGSTFSVYGQNLPEVRATGEPLNLAILEGSASSVLFDFANRVYLAQFGRWSASGNLTAWSEGVYVPGVNYAYEWVLDTIPVPQAFVMRAANQTVLDNAAKYPPFAYTKVAFSYLAIYGENAYTLALVGAVKGLASSNGFGEAVLENGVSAASLFSSSPNSFYSDKTNEQVLASAFAAISGGIAQVKFFTNPSSSALVGWGSCAGPSYGNGQSIFSAAYGSVPVCYVPSGYTLSSWTCTGGLACSGSSDPSTASFTGSGTITLNVKVGSFSNPVSTSLTTMASPSNPLRGTTFTVSGTLTPNGAGSGGEQIVLVFEWNGATATVTTRADGSYTYTATAPGSTGSYDIQVFFLGDLGGSTQYLPSTATAHITVR